MRSVVRSVVRSAAAVLVVAAALCWAAAGVAGAWPGADGLVVLAASASDEPPAWPLAVAVVLSVAAGLWWTNRRRR